MNLSAELIHIVTDQPFRMPGKARVSQEQRMYAMVKSKGVDVAIDWFKSKGKKAAWGGANQALAKQLIKDGRIDDGIRLLEFDVELSPGKSGSCGRPPRPASATAGQRKRSRWP